MSTERIKHFYSLFCCPLCSAPAAVMRAVPGEADGVRNYTDGVNIEPLFIDTPSIALCASCKEFYWCDDGVDAHAMRSSESAETDFAKACSAANWIVDPTEQELLEALRQGMAKT